MRCLRCGNEISQGEVFCGQCGAPNTPPAQPTEMVNTPSPQNSMLGAYNTGRTNAPFTPPQTNASHPPTRPPVSPPYPSTRPTPDMQNFNPPSLSNATFTSNQPDRQPGINQQTGFYNDATEAMSSLSTRSAQGYGADYAQQGIPNAPMQGGYPAPGIYPPQAYQPGGYENQGYPASYPSGQSGYQYGTQFNPSPIPEKRRGNGMVITVSVLLVIALISVVGLATLYIVRSNSASSSTATTPSNTAPTASSPTVLPSPTATIAPSPTVLPSPSPTIAVTAAADEGYSLCGIVCTNYGFSTEYPNNWQPGATPGVSGIQFTSATQQDIYANFKADGTTTSSADALVSSDLQNYFANKPNYTAPGGLSTTTISGETWVTGIAYYTNQPQSTQQDQQTAKERVEVYATVHQGKAYIIELQAPDSQFDAVNTQYFINMLGKFQFLAMTQ